MTLDELTVNFRDLNRDQLLSDWAWMVGSSRLPILLTASGDAFLQDKANGSISVLDVAAGELIPVAKSLGEFQRLLADRTFVLNHFAVEMVSDLRRSGRLLGPGQIYSFRKPPILGGEYTLENIEVTDIEVHFSIAGQLHKQVHGRAPGTPVGGAAIE